MPKVSICIPTYNNLSAFKRCFDSVLNQSYRDYEVIITDDSTNDSIKSYLENIQLSENIHYFKNKQPLGSPENWNEAIRKATGEYIKILHHDDFFTYETSLQIFIDLLDKNPEADLGFVASKNFNLSKNEIINYNKPSQKKLDEIKKNPYILLNGNYIGAPSATIFRNKPNLFFDKNLIWFVDLEFYINILSKNNILIYNSLDAITVGGDDTRISNSVQNDKKVNVFEFFYILNKWNITEIRFSIFENILKKIITKYKITKIKDIREIGYNGSLPLDIKQYFQKALFYRSKKIIKNNLYKLKNIVISKWKNNFLSNRRKVVNNNFEKNINIGERTIIEQSELGSYIKIGSDSYIHNVKYGDFSFNSIRTTIINCEIGKFCSIAQGVSIGLGKHPLNKFVSTHPSFYSTHKQCGFTFVNQQKFDEMGKIIIGNDVWIGANAIIADDVKIGNGAVVAANSFVNVDVPDYAIVGGTPAKILKYRFSTEEIEFLLKLKWWEKDIFWLEDNKELMLDVELLMRKYANDHH